MSHRLTRSQIGKSQDFKTNNAPDIEDIVLETSDGTGRKRKHREAQDSASQLLEDSSTLKSSKVQVKEGNVKPSRNSNCDITVQVQRHPVKQEMQSDGKVITSAPANWKEMYSLTAAMRKLNPAPVDTMGCESLAEAGLSDRDRRFQTLIALMLSSQTKDTVTALTIRRLQTELPRPGLTLERILEVEPVKLNEMIWAVGFHNNKTKFIKRTAEVLHEKFNGDIPDTIEGMTSLPGVGPKMAYLCMSSAWGRDEGIGVDVHVHRITNLWGWHKTKTPEQTRAVLESWLPKDKWHDINHLLVGFGQTICVPIGRRCHECTLSEKNLCPSAVVDRKVGIHNVGRKKGHRKTTVKLEEDASTIDGGQVKSEAILRQTDPIAD